MKHKRKHKKVSQDIMEEKQSIVERKERRELEKIHRNFKKDEKF